MRQKERNAAPGYVNPVSWSRAFSLTVRTERLRLPVVRVSQPGVNTTARYAPGALGSEEKPDTSSVFRCPTA